MRRWRLSTQPHKKAPLSQQIMLVILGPALRNCAAHFIRLVLWTCARLISHNSSASDVRWAGELPVHLTRLNHLNLLLQRFSRGSTGRDFFFLPASNLQEGRAFNTFDSFSVYIRPNKYRKKVLFYEYRIKDRCR